MAICVGDLHGDIDKLKAFLMFRPDEEHIILGDICDDWTAPDKQIEDCIKLIFKKRDNPVTVICGNHDLHYMTSSPFTCSGFRSAASNTFKLIRKHEKKFKMAIIRDGFVITHE